MRHPVRRSSEFVAGVLCAAALLLVTLGGAGLLSAQVFLGPKRDFVALATTGSGQRDVSIDMTTSPPRLEIGRSVVNGLRFTGGATGTTPVITAAVTGADAGAGLALNPGSSGYVAIGGTHNTQHLFFNAAQFCNDSSSSTTAVVTRIAANDWGLRRTSGADETHNVACFIDLPGARTTASKGVRIDSMDIVHQITGAALLSHAVTNAAFTVYANNIANSVNGMTISGTLSTATQTLPYTEGLTMSSAAFHTTQLAGFTVEMAPRLSTTSVYTLYGVNVRYSAAYY